MSREPRSTHEIRADLDIVYRELGLDVDDTDLCGEAAAIRLAVDVEVLLAVLAERDATIAELQAECNAWANGDKDALLALYRLAAPSGEPTP